MAPPASQRRACGGVGVICADTSLSYPPMPLHRVWGVLYAPECGKRDTRFRGCHGRMVRRQGVGGACGGIRGYRPFRMTCSASRRARISGGVSVATSRDSVCQSVCFPDASCSYSPYPTPLPWWRSFVRERLRGAIIRLNRHIAMKVQMVGSFPARVNRLRGLPRPIHRLWSARVFSSQA